MQPEIKIIDYLTKQARRCLSAQLLENIFCALGFASLVASLIFIVVAIFPQSKFASISLQITLAVYILMLAIFAVKTFSARLSKLQIAQLIDRKADLKQKLSTAYELLCKGDKTPAGQAVIITTAKLLDKKTLEQISFFKLNQQKKALIALLIFCSLATGLFADWRMTPADLNQSIAANFGELTEAQRKMLIDELVKKANDPENATEATPMKSIARVVKAGSRDQLAKLLEKIHKQGYDLKKILPDQFKFLAAAQLSDLPANENNSASGGAKKDANNQASITVYNPDYAKEIEKKRQASSGKIVRYQNWRELVKQMNQRAKPTSFAPRYQPAINRYFRQPDSQANK